MPSHAVSRKHPDGFGRRTAIGSIEGIARRVHRGGYRQASRLLQQLCLQTFGFPFELFDLLPLRLGPNSKAAFPILLQGKDRIQLGFATIERAGPGLEILHQIFRMPLQKQIWQPPIGGLRANRRSGTATV